mgnify:CR=1 FL=1
MTFSVFWSVHISYPSVGRFLGFISIPQSSTCLSSSQVHFDVAGAFVSSPPKSYFRWTYNTTTLRTLSRIVFSLQFFNPLDFVSNTLLKFIDHDIDTSFSDSTSRGQLQFFYQFLCTSLAEMYFVLLVNIPSAVSYFHLTIYILFPNIAITRTANPKHAQAVLSTTHQLLFLPVCRLCNNRPAVSRQC